MAKKSGVFPWEPAISDEEDQRAFKALQAGVASPQQQKTALDFVINKAARTYDLSFRPDSERATCFAEGKRWVGLQIVSMLNRPVVEKPAKP